MYSRCWLPFIQNNKWFKKIFKIKIFKKIYIPNNNSFLKKEIIFFTNKYLSKFTNIRKKAKLIFNYQYFLKNEEYSLKYKNNKLYINSKNNNGFIYGLFHLFKLIQLNFLDKNKNFYIEEKPDIKIRMINNIDHINGNINKNYSGNSIFFFNNKVHYNLLRIKYYARLLASININSLCINNNNVNLNDTYLITKNWLIQLYEIYNIYIKYNIKIFLSINYKSHIILGKLSSLNPLNKKVIKWWEKKIENIYSYMPYLGGLVINFKKCTEKKIIINYSKLIAKLLNNFNGILILKCSVYKKYNWRFRNIDKACSIYDKFNNLDGLLLKNVILKINDGPIGNQVREPVSSLLGSMKNTSQILEFKINQEYTGHQIDICWLLPKWKNILNFNTYCLGNKSKIKKLISGKIYNMKYYGISGTSNIGDNLNWTGNELAQANIFGYGRLLWNLNINLNNLLKEWIKLSFNSNNLLIKNISKIMFNSWKTYEEYTSPLGIGGMFNPYNKYDPNVDGNEYTQSGIYHYSNKYSLGVRRKKYIKQYFYKNKIKFNNINRCPEKLILFFHNLPYKFYLKKNKKTIIQYIYDTHFKSVNTIIKWIFLWKEIKRFIPPLIFKNVKKKLRKQYINACKWRDQINTYFLRKSGIKDKYNRKIYL